MPDVKAYTQDETMQYIIAKAKELGDSFTFRIMRRSKMGTPEIVASFENAQVEHVAKVETWLPQLAGGGMFFLTVWHESDPGNPIGSPLTFNFAGQSKQVDPTEV